MRIFKLLSIIMCAALWFDNANGDIQQCLYLDASQNCTSASSSDIHSWNATCNSVKVYGVAVCAVDHVSCPRFSNATSNSSTLRVLETDQSATCNRACYCKMIYPVVSEYWVLAKDQYTNAMECFGQCARQCRDYMISSDGISMRQALFGTFKE